MSKALDCLAMVVVATAEVIAFIAVIAVLTTVAVLFWPITLAILLILLFGWSWDRVTDKKL